MSNTPNLVKDSGQLIRPPTPEETAAITFPESGYVGVAARFAEAYSQEYESPKEFLFWDCLALIGAIISGRVRPNFGLPCQPRLYVVKVAASAWQRKSTSTRFADKFIRSVLETLDTDKLHPRDWPKIIYGVGSAEGLATCLSPQPISDTGSSNGKHRKKQTTRRVVLSFDEFRRFEAKAGITNSALLPMVNELYEANKYDNVVKETNINISDGHLVFLSNSTEETYRNLVNAPEFRDIGFLNRLVVVSSDSRKRVAEPQSPPESVLGPIREELASYIADLPPLNEDGSASREVILALTPEAKEEWHDWYHALEETEETARLDNLGMRLMGLLAFSSGQSKIDGELLRRVLDILEYERQVRSIYRPFDAANHAALMEQKIRFALERKGPMTKRDLQRATNASRYGARIFKDALSSLISTREVRLNRDKKYELSRN